MKGFVPRPVSDNSTPEFRSEYARWMAHGHTWRCLRHRLSAFLIRRLFGKRPHIHYALHLKTNRAFRWLKTWGDHG